MRPPNRAGPPAAPSPERRAEPARPLAEQFFALDSKRRIAEIAALGQSSGSSASSLPDIDTEAALVEAARAGDKAALGRVFKERLHLPDRISAKILADASHEALAVLCLGFGIARAVYSTLVVLSPLAPEQANKTAALAHYDRFDAAGARALALAWQEPAGSTPTPAARTSGSAEPLRPPPPGEIWKPAPASPRKTFGRLKREKSDEHKTQADAPRAPGVIFGRAEEDDL